MSTIVCKTCHKDFVHSKDDVKFLQKMAEIDQHVSHIPAPKECMYCRQMRRMSFRNERMLYERICDITENKIISVHSPDSPYIICNKDYWYSSNVDPLDYGSEYNFQKDFFQQFTEMMKQIPLPSLRVERSENCEYNNDMSDCTNCYLCARTHQCQDMLYCYRGNTSSSCIDCFQVTKCDLLYECTECTECTNGKFLFFCSKCTDSSYLLDCSNCTDCFMCTNLRNKRHCFFNQQLTPEQYKQKIAEFDFGSYAMVQKANLMFTDIKKKAIRRNLMIIHSEDCTGDNIFESKNCHLCFGVQSSQDSRYLWDIKKYKDGMDCYTGGRNSELIYNCTSTTASYNCKFCMRAANSENITYGYLITGCKNIFGCVGLTSKEYCIFNTQYTEDDYHALVPKIIEHMLSTGEFGEFFPPHCSPFPYNDTGAYEMFPLQKEHAISLGYRWSEKNPKNYQRQTYVLSDCVLDTDNTICSEILACKTCAKNYKITPTELLFYKKIHVPIPRYCHDCRHNERLKSKNPPYIYESICKKTGEKILTTFPKNTEMQIYSSNAYQESVG